MILTHWGRTPVTTVYDVEEQDGYFKPFGLWLSTGDEWRDWCVDNQFREDECVHRTDFELTPGHSVLVIETPGQMEAFTEEYGYDREYVGHWIDWTRVKARYDGVVVIPYQYGCRLDERFWWYYSWDVSGGCVWRPSRALERVTAPVSA